MDHFVMVFGFAVSWQWVQKTFWKRAGLTCTPFHLYFASWYSPQCWHLMASSWICPQQYLHVFILSGVFSDKMAILFCEFIGACKLLQVLFVKAVWFAVENPGQKVLYETKWQEFLKEFAKICQNNDPGFLWILGKVPLEILWIHLDDLSFHRIERPAIQSQCVLSVKQILTLLAIILGDHLWSLFPNILPGFGSFLDLFCTSKACVCFVGCGVFSTKELCLCHGIVKIGNKKPLW